ncbi:MAG TPA: hypothetical protein VGS58_14515 [Candidatus Sulfopaludibacter sp.]|nr:hypothetical protein [Candidatus Sulfopaludibacter sp.]
MPLARKALPTARTAFSARCGECIRRAASEIELRAMLHAFSEALKRLNGKPRLDFIEGNHS